MYLAVQSRFCAPLTPNEVTHKAHSARLADGSEFVGHRDESAAAARRGWGGFLRLGGHEKTTNQTIFEKEQAALP